MVNILTIGDSPYIHLYNWIFNKYEGIKTYHHTSKKYKIIVNDIYINTDSYYPTSSIDKRVKYDYIFIHANSLEDLNSSLATIDKDLQNSNAKVVIDNTGSIPLTNFINENYAKLSNAIFVLNQINIIPTKFENNTITYTLAKNNDNNILINNNDSSFSTFMTKHFSNFNVIVNLSNFNLLVMKYNIYFTIIQSLMLIFELDSIQKLEKFILCKPILKGLFNEIVNINNMKEDGDFKNLKSYFKWLYLNENLINPIEIHLFDLNLDNSFDINILYPILLADDLSIKIPYLEFLYSILQQLKLYKKTNVRFLNKLMYSNKLKELNLKLVRLDNNLNDQNNVLISQLDTLKSSNATLNQKNENLINENDSLKSQLEIQVSDLQKRLNDEHVFNKELSAKLENLQLQELKNVDEEPNDKEKQTTYRKSINSQLRLMLSDDDMEDFVDANDSPAINDVAVKNRRSIQGVNAQFNSPRSNTEVGIKALEEIQMFTEYGIYYGSPQKQMSEDLKVEVNSDIDNTDVDKTDINNDIDNINLNDLKKREMELNHREMMLKQREKMYTESIRKLPPPPKQQFPPMPRKSSLNNLQRGSVYQNGPYNQQIQFNQQVQFNQQAQFSQQPQYNQQAQHNLPSMPYNPHPIQGVQNYGRSISQPIQNHNQQAVLSHPVHMKTSRKNRTSMLPTASKMKKDDFLKNEALNDYPGFSGSYNIISAKNSSGNLLSNAGNVSHGSIGMNHGFHSNSANVSNGSVNILNSDNNLSQSNISKKNSVSNLISNIPQTTNTSKPLTNQHVSVSLNASNTTAPNTIVGNANEQIHKSKTLSGDNNLLNVIEENQRADIADDLKHQDVTSDEFKLDVKTVEVNQDDKKPVEKKKRKKSLNIFGNRKSS